MKTNEQVVMSNVHPKHMEIQYNKYNIHLKEVPRIYFIAR